MDVVTSPNQLWIFFFSFVEISMDAEEEEDGEVENRDTTVELRPSMWIFKCHKYFDGIWILLFKMK